MAGTINVGDLVRVKATSGASAKFVGRTFKVVRFLQKNVEVRDVVSGGIVRGRPLAFELVGTAGAQLGASGAVVEAVPLPELFHPGQVVSRKKDLPASAKWKYAEGTQFVVLSQAASGRVKIAKLGGEDGMTWTVPDTSLDLQAV